MEKQLLQVLEFQKAFNVEIPTTPKMLRKTRAKLRQSLLEEEVKELLEAKNIIDVADAIVDILYITYGTAHEYGIADRLILLFDEIHKSNMTKVGADGKALFRRDGKVLKPENYTEPNLRPILERDFSIYKSSDLAKELAEIESNIVNGIIHNTIKKNLSFFDRILFSIYNKLESILEKKVQVEFPKVIVYGKEHVIKG
jgi:predicted HAD superfamily Cof-like phosphohydrolase